MITEQHRHELLDDARSELRDSAEDLFYAATLLRRAGDHSAAAAVAKHAQELLALASGVGRPS